MIVSAIAAMARNRVVGKDNQLCWNIPEDLKRFRAITSGHPIIMGRKTFESIGRPLPNRENIVLTRSADYRRDGITVVHSVDEALRKCAGKAQAFVIGGGEIWEQAMPRIQRIYLTLVHRDFEGDAFFPEWPADFREVEREDHLEAPLPFSYILLQR